MFCFAGRFGRFRLPRRVFQGRFGRIPAEIGEKVAAGFGDRKVLDKVAGRFQ